MKRKRRIVAMDVNYLEILKNFQCVCPEPIPINLDASVLFPHVCFNIR